MFAGLTPDTTYTGYIRYAATMDYEAGEAVSQTIATLKPDPVIPPTGDHAAPWALVSVMGISLPALLVVKKKAKR